MWERKVAPLSGVAAAVLIVGSALIINNYQFMPPAEDVADFYQTNPVRIMVGAYTGTLAAFFMLWFAGSVRETLRASGNDRLGLIAFGGGTLASGMILLGYLAQIAGADRARIHDSISPDTAATLFDMSGLAVGTGGAIGMAALIGAFGVAAFTEGSQPRWLGITSVLIGIGLISPINSVLLALGIVWVPVVSVRLYREGSKTTRQVEAGA
jgi:hypothetical protein